MLAAKFKANAEAKGIAVVFVSSDQDESHFNEYYGEMPWLALPFSERQTKATLSTKYGVQNIPTLVVLDGNGELVTKEGTIFSALACRNVSGRLEEYFGPGGDAPTATEGCRIL